VKEFVDKLTGVTTADDDDKKIEFFKTRDPKVLIETIVKYELTDATKKAAVKIAMEGETKGGTGADRDEKLSLTVYGDGSEFTDDGMSKYLYEKEIDIKHTFGKAENPQKGNSEKTF
jgi:hypothetical protein